MDVLYCEPGRLLCRANKVLLAVDGTKGAAKAATLAFEIAELTKSKLFILHVVPVPAIRHFSFMSESDAQEVLRRYEENGKRLLEGYKKAAAAYSIDVETIIEKGLPSDRIVSTAKQREVDIVVIGSEGASGSKRTGLGGQTERVILGAHCPVLVAK